MTIDKVSFPGQLMTPSLTDLISLYISICSPVQSLVKGIRDTCVVTMVWSSSPTIKYESNF